MARFVIPIILILVFAVYFAVQVCPTFYYWDSAELTAAVASGGVPHPPGFPVLLILGKIFVAIAPLNVGGALSLLSALFAVAGLGIWFFAVRAVLQMYSEKPRHLTVDLISLLTTVVLGTSFAFGIQAVRFEVYSLSFALFAAMFLIALSICRSGDGNTARLLLLAVVVGLALGTHILTIGLALPGIFMLLFRSRRVRIGSILIGAFVSIVLASLAYGYIYYLARQQPILNWGDPSDLRRFLDYFTAREFTTSISSFGPGHIIANFVFVVNLMVRQFGLPAMLLSLWGLYNLAGFRKRVGYPLILILVLNVFSIIFSEDFYYGNYDQQGYLLISLAVVSLSGAVGLWSLHGFLAGFVQSRRLTSPGNKALIGAVLAAILIYAYPLIENTFSADLSGVHGAEEYANEFSGSAPDKAIIITSYYNTYFCLAAEEAISGDSHTAAILNIYNWDHRWGRNDSRRRYEKALDVDVDRQTFYRNFLNALMRDVPIYIEYDESSAPLAKYLRPDGLGYLLTAPDTSVISAGKATGEIKSRLADLAERKDLETVKTWVLWFQNRGNFHKHRGYPGLAAAYYAAAESVAVYQSR
jgi:hypothetical protein